MSVKGARSLDMLAVLLAAAAFFVGAFALAKLRSSVGAGVALAVVAAALGYAAFRLNKRVKQLSVAPPFKLPADFRAPFIVLSGNGRLVRLLMGAILFGAPAYPMYQEKPIVGVLVGAFAMFCVVAIVLELRWRGEPVLRVDETGIHARYFGFIPWGDVDRVFMQVREHRGVKAHSLALALGEPEKYFKRMHPIMRWLHRLDLPINRDQIAIPIDFLSHMPAHIEAAVNHLREKFAAGIGVRLRSGDLSMDTRMAQIDKLMKGIRPEDGIAKAEATMREVGRLNNELQQELRENFEKVRTSSFWSLAIMVLLVVVFVALWWLGQL